VWLLNASQCEEGRVVQGTNQPTSRSWWAAYHITTEAAVTKLMFVFGQRSAPAELLMQDLRGEITP
jgi:L-asparaginase